MKYKLFLPFLFLILIFPLYSQDVLDEFNTSWTVVTPGKVVSEPELTSFGFCIITDAQDISAFSNKGKLLWNKPIVQGRKAFVGALSDDFFAVVANYGTQLTLLNSSGCTIWSKHIDYKITKKPFSGRDGRFFVSGTNNLQCFGINGVSKWKINTPEQSDLPILELNDGSLLVFLKQEIDGQSTGLRISPFGELLENIQFFSKVEYASVCNEGILINYSNGISGLFNVKNRKAENKWFVTIKEGADKKNQFIVSQNKNEAVIISPFSDHLLVSCIDIKNGNIKNSFKINKINGNNLKKTVLNSNGLFLCDEKNVLFYTLFNDELYSAQMPSISSANSDQQWNYLIFNNENFLIFCQNNWNLSAYHIITEDNVIYHAPIESRRYNYFINSAYGDYSVLLPADSETKLLNKERLNSITNGNYGKKEKLYLQDMLATCEALNSNFQVQIINPEQEKNKTIFDTDATGVGNFLSQIPLYSTVEAASYTAQFLKKMKNKSFQQLLLNGVSKVGYDPYGQILEAIDIISTHITPRDEGVICAACDAVYSICLFMGRPAFNSKGKAIIARFITPDFSIKTRKYTYKVLKQISDLDL